VLVGELGDEQRDLLQRLAEVDTAGEIDGEVHPVRERRRIDDPVGDDALRGHVLKITGAPVEENGELAVVDGHLGDARRHRHEPEREPAPAPGEPLAAVVEDVRARVRP
jgi:hypothetical protein